MQDELKDIKGYEGIYKVNKKGEIFNKVGKKRKICNNGKGAGYYFVRLTKNGKSKNKYIHRILAEAFIGNINKKVINHINGISTDNRIENLEIVSQKQNIHHYWNFIKNKYILCMETGIFYNSISEAAKSVSMPKQTLGNQLIGRYKNKTSLIYC